MVSSLRSMAISVIGGRGVSSVFILWVYYTMLGRYDYGANENSRFLHLDDEEADDHRLLAAHVNLLVVALPNGSAVAIRVRALCEHTIL